MANKATNNILAQLLSGDVLSGLASTTNSSQNDVQSVLVNALPSLISGASAQNSNAATSASFLNALTQHGSQDTSTASLFSGLDLVDGGKIVNHLLGNQKEETTVEVAKKTGVSSDKVNSIISAVAPILMAYLGKQLISNISGSSTATTTTTTAKKKKKKTESTVTTTAKKKKKKAEEEEEETSLGNDLLSSAASSLLGSLDVGSILTSLLK